MSVKLLKGLGIFTLVIVTLFVAIEVWVYIRRDEIFQRVKEAINKNINGELKIRDFKFQPFSGGYGLNFTLFDVELTDTLYKVHKTPVLMAERIHIVIDLNTIYKGEIKFKNVITENGGLRIFVRKDGYTNLSVFHKPEEKKATGNGVEKLNDWVRRLGVLRFVRFEVTFHDSTTSKRYGAIFLDASNRMAERDSAVDIRFGGSIFFKGLVFKPEKGGFLMNQETSLDMHMSYNPKRQQLTILPSTLETITKDQIEIRGRFDLADSVKHFQLGFNSKGIEVGHALPLLEKFLSQKIDSLGIKTVVAADVKIKGDLKPGKPRAVITFKTAPFTYDLPVGKLQKVQISASYTNQADTNRLPGPENARLASSMAKGMFESLPFQLKFAVTDLTNPRAVLDGQINADSINLEGVVDPNRYRFKKGAVQISFHFDGDVRKFYDPQKDALNGILYGKVSLKDIAVDYLPRGVHLSDINGVFVFNHRAVVFPSFSIADGMNKLYIKGRVIDLIPFLFGSPRPVRAVVDLNIPNWKLNWLEALVVPKTRSRKPARKRMKLSDILDDVIDKMSIEATLRSNRLTYKSFRGTDVKGSFTISDNAMSINNFSMNAFGKGHFEISGGLDNSGKRSVPVASLKGKIVNADVHNVFSSFNNFGQKAITQENIRGRLNSSFHFESHLTNSVKLIPSSMKGNLKIDFRGGYILNFEPFLKMKKLVFKNRNFEKVELAPITNDFVLKGQEIEIKPMEIESNVMTLYVDGIYSFGNKTDINIQIPLSNLKKRDSTYVLAPHEAGRKNGANVYLRAVDEGGEVNIKLAFKKKEKKDKKDKKQKKDSEEN